MNFVRLSIVVGLLVSSCASSGTDAAAVPAADPPVSDVACAVSGPQYDDRRAPLRTDLGRNQTIIAVRRNEISGNTSRELDMYLKQRGAVLGRVESNGRFGVKAAWSRDRRAAGRLSVTGKRLNRPGGWFRAEINRLYGGRRFARIVPSRLFFSSVGCWRITARAGRSRITYTVLVRRPHPGEL